MRMVAEISDQYNSGWAAISKVARLLGVGTAAENPRSGSARPRLMPAHGTGATTDESAELKRL